MNAPAIEYIVGLLLDSKIVEFECKTERARLKLHFDAQADACEDLPQQPNCAASSPLRDKSQVNTIKAPATGVFSRTHPAVCPECDDKPSQVKTGQVIGFLRIDDVLSPVLASMDGSFEPLVADGTLVGFGDELFSFHIKE